MIPYRADTRLLVGGRVRVLHGGLLPSRRADRAAGAAAAGDGEARPITFPEPLYTVSPGLEPGVHADHVPARLQLDGHAGHGVRLRHGDRLADAAEAAAGAAVARRACRSPPTTTSSTASGRWRPTGRGCRSRWCAARARRATGPRPACCTGTAATSTPSTRRSRSPGCRCSTAASCSRSRTSAAAARLGRPWYDHGKMLEKKNTFTDFVACAAHLVAAGLDVGVPAGRPRRLGRRPADGRGGQPGARPRSPGSSRRCRSWTR